MGRQKTNMVSTNTENEQIAEVEDVKSPQTMQDALGGVVEPIAHADTCVESPRFIPAEINDNIIKSQLITWAKTHLSTEEREFEFRKYQLEALLMVMNKLISSLFITFDSVEGTYRIEKNEDEPIRSNFGIISAPTGSGKSFMSIILAGVLSEYYGLTSAILCTDLFLFDQYSSDFDKYKLYTCGFASQKGANSRNYDCIRSGSIEDAPCILCTSGILSEIIDVKTISPTGDDKGNCDYIYEPKNFIWDCARECNYIKDRVRMRMAKVKLMTYQMYIMHAKNGNKNVADIIFADECHKIPDIVQNSFSIELKPDTILDDIDVMMRSYRKIITDGRLSNGYNENLPLKKLESSDEYISNTNEFKHRIISDIYKMSADNYQKHWDTLQDLFEFFRDHFASYAFSFQNCIKAFMDDNVNNSDKKVQRLSRSEYLASKAAGRISKMYQDIKGYLENTKKNPLILVKSELKNVDNVTPAGVSYRIADESMLCRKYFLSKSPVGAVMLSATVGDIPVYKKNMSLTDDETLVIKIPSTFDFSTSPIYFMPGYPMSMQRIHTSIDKNVERLIKIMTCPTHINQRGIIHSGTYQIAKMVIDKLPDNLKERCILYNTAAEKDVCFNKFTKTPGAVLIGPTLVEGIDTKDDLCRFIVIMKVPYPYLGDNLVKAKMKLYEGWYESMANNAIVQGIGRGNRHPHDQCVTYILDDNFGVLYRKTNYMYDQTFKNRLKMLNL